MCETGTNGLPLISPATRSASETTGDSVELTRSLADSGHYDDLTSPALSARVSRFFFLYIAVVLHQQSMVFVGILSQYLCVKQEGRRDVFWT